MKSFTRVIATITTTLPFSLVNWVFMESYIKSRLSSCDSNRSIDFDFLSSPLYDESRRVLE